MCIIMHAISHVLSACILMSVPSLSILRNMRYAPILCVRAEHREVGLTLRHFFALSIKC